MRLLVTALLVAVPLTLPARQHPDFSGTWTAVPDAPAEAAPASGPLLGPTFGITHKGDIVTMRRLTRNQVVDATFTIGGAETRVRVPGRLCEGDAATIEKLAWSGDTLVHGLLGAIDPGTTVMRPIPNTTHLMRLEGTDTLVVRRQFPARENTPARTLGTVYKRTSESLPEPDPPAVKGVAADIAKVAWISGDWFGTTERLTFEERWTPPASGSIIALGRTLDARGFLIRFELLCVAEQQGGLVYLAMPQGRMPPTAFRLTALTDESATFENPDNNFPKVIRYARRPDGSLETTISGANNERAQSFVMKRRE
jgi:hypothetical protein